MGYGNLKKCVKLILFLIICYLFTGCKKGDSGDKEIISTSLIDAGDKVVSTMSNMVSNEDYKKLMSVPEDMESAVSLIESGDYKSPLNIYELHIPESRIETIASMSSEVSLSDMNDGLRDNVTDKIYAALANQINGRYYGAMYMAAASMYTCNQLFVNSELQENKVYLYTFEKGCPIMISFIKGDDGATMAVGSFLMYKELDNTDEAVAEMVKDTLYISDSLIEKLR